MGRQRLNTPEPIHSFWPITRYLSEVVRFTVAASGISADGQYLRAVGG